MRAFAVGLYLFVAVLFPKTGNAQVYQFRTPPPEVTAAGAAWQVTSEPVLVGGLVYYPTRGFRFFDGQVMAQVGLYEGVPVYTDTTLEPYSVLYVPTGRDRMREYERRRDGELAGTTGSRVPSFPVKSPSAQALRQRPVGAVGTTGTVEPAPQAPGAWSYVLSPPLTTIAETPAVIATAGAIDSRGMSAVGTAGVADRAVGTAGVADRAVGTSGAPDRARARRSLVESIPRPVGANGVWLEFNGAKWYSDGPAASYTPGRFEPIGEYRGFPVYRDKQSTRHEIWVSVVKDGPIAPYVRR